MKENFYKHQIMASPTGYAYNKIIYDNNGMPCNFEFIEVNDAFLKILALKEKNVIGKKFSDIFPLVKSLNLNLIEYLSNLKPSKSFIEIEEYIEPLKKWFRIYVNSYEEHYFSINIIDISKEKTQLDIMAKLVDSTEEFLQIEQKDIDYYKILKELTSFCGGSYATFNLYEEDGLFFKTVALYGNKTSINKAMKIIGEKIQGKIWPHDVYRAKLIEDSTITRLSSLSALTNNALPKAITLLIEKTFNIGEIVLIKIMKNNVMLGDLTIYLKKGEKFKNPSIAEIYSKLVGMLISRTRAENFLKQEKIFNEALLDSTQGYFYVYDDKGKLIKWNKKHEEMTGYSSVELSGMTLDKWFEGNDLIKVNDAVNRVFKYGYGQVEADLILKDKSKLSVRSNGVRLNIDGQRLFVGIGTDITEQKKAEQTLRASEEKYRLLTEFASDVIWVFDVSLDRITYVSPSSYFLNGFLPEEITLMSIKEMLAHNSYEYIKDIFDKYVLEFINNPNSLEHNLDEVEMLCKNGEYVWVELSTKFRFNQNDDVEIVGVARNIDKRKKSEKEVLYLNYHDQLTGLYNRRYYEEELKRLDKESNLPISLVMGDLNGLKLVNDSFGHVTGDQLLKKAAEVITLSCKKTDIVARLGGDEIVIIMPRTTENEAKQIIKKIIDLSLTEKTGTISLSISFGHATKSTMEEELSEVFRLAEDKMYSKKLYESLSMRNKTIDLIMNTLFEKSQREMLHSRRVSDICKQIAICLEFEQDAVQHMATAGLMHDIGKMGVNEEILNKTGTLTTEEWKAIKKHPEIGYRILSASNDFSELATYILEHHERWDGKGYPNGIAGNKISIEARIIALADAYDAMISDRPYRKGLSREEALNEIKRNAGFQFDPHITKLFIEKILQREW